MDRRFAFQVREASVELVVGVSTASPTVLGSASLLCPGVSFLFPLRSPFCCLISHTPLHSLRLAFLKVLSPPSVDYPVVSSHIHANTHAHICTHIYTCTHNTLTHAHINTYIYIHAYTHAHSVSYTYTCTYIHTYTVSHTYIHMLS